ncbi:MAG: hypothetical protein A3G34_16350 [Candidatus Lindowbacteria bacterium RIFCSPLOWO2_12_FULL_62_27]|nr:MAG: hypothetical protein A3G34_16350 [Candidatus Lindowbacteria bacterium RIFCSPLOWO2_12_FULL_62_27]
MIVLDTDTVIYFLNGVKPVVQKAGEAGLQHLAVASPTLGELYYGACRSQKKQANLTRVEELAENIILLPIDREVCRRFGELKAGLAGRVSASGAPSAGVSDAGRGLPVGDVDTFIAATALVHHATLVTHNTKHFNLFPGLRTEDWYV